MIAACLLVAGALRATLPGDAFTLSWQHSVEKTRWEERYRVDGDALRLVEASVAGFGAGMEPPADAVKRDGRWIWHPDRTLRELRLTWSSFTSDYELCAQSHCGSLRDWAGPLDDGAIVVVRGCDR